MCLIVNSSGIARELHASCFNFTGGPPYQYLSLADGFQHQRCLFFVYSKIWDFFHFTIEWFWTKVPINLFIQKQTNLTKIWFKNNSQSRGFSIFAVKIWVPPSLKRAESGCPPPPEPFLITPLYVFYCLIWTICFLNNYNFAKSGHPLPVDWQNLGRANM